MLALLCKIGGSSAYKSCKKKKKKKDMYIYIFKVNLTRLFCKMKIIEQKLDIERKGGGERGTPGLEQLGARLQDRRRQKSTALGCS